MLPARTLADPSHFERNTTECCSFERLLSVYRARAYRTVSGDDIQRSVMASAGLTGAHAAAFLERPDFRSMKHAEDAVYDSQVLTGSNAA